ncbi:MAG: hypothetical protein GZ094_09445 [Mariniphaga sp.]|nr:hypothetical protein [Mariniphaga sp.]
MTIVDWIGLFTRPAYKHVIVDSLNYCIANKGLQVYCWCLMSNHLHIIASAAEENNLSDILRDLKKFTSKDLIKSIKETPESRRDWLLNLFSFVGLQIQCLKGADFKSAPAAAGINKLTANIFPPRKSFF